MLIKEQRPSAIKLTVKNCISSSNTTGFEADSFQRDFIQDFWSNSQIGIYAVWLQAGTADHFFKDAAFVLNGINRPAATLVVQPAMLTNLLLTLLIHR